MSLFSFDHTNGFGVSEKEFSDLAELGFTLEPYAVEHPGSLFCRFINFSGGTLEFIENRDKATYLENLEEGETPFENGLSLKSQKSAREIYESKKSLLDEYGLNYVHKNYDWKEDPTSNLLGWNFLLFSKNIVYDIYVWVTEYEEPRKRPRVVPKHRNSANTLLGAYWNVDSLSDLAAFEKFTEHRVQDGKAVFPSSEGNFTLWVEEKNSGSQLANYYAKAKTSPYRAVVLKADDKELFDQCVGEREKITFMDQEATILRLNSQIWDILVV